MAGAVGIEPPQAVLETAVLPLYDAPIKSHRKMARMLFRFLVQGLLFVEFAILHEFQALLGVFLVLLGLVIQIMANRAFQTNQMILGH